MTIFSGGEQFDMEEKKVGMGLCNIRGDGDGELAGTEIFPW